MKEATIFAERVIAKCREIALETPNGTCAFTVSMGLCPLNNDATELLEPIKCADDALYRAKAAGRDQLQVALAA